MKTKGGIDDFKLYYEDLPSVSKFKKPKNKKNQSKSKKDILANDIRIGFALYLPYIIQSRQIPNRTAVLSNIDDRKIMPKVPPTSKKRTTNAKRQKVV